MNYGIVNENSTELRKLTDMLLSACPGGVVYEFINPMDVLGQIKGNKLNAVLLDSALKNIQVMELLKKIRELSNSIPVAICAPDDSLLDEAMWFGASSYFVKPLLPEQLLEAMGR